MEDPLVRALAESPAPPIHPAPAVVDEHTTHPQPVRDILDDVLQQATAALSEPFFDGHKETTVEPVIKIGVAEAGTVRITAERLEPPYHAVFTLYVRSDLRSTSDGRYEVRGRCELSRGKMETTSQSDFAVGVAIDRDGMVALDVERLRAELAQAIRSFD